MLHPLEYVCMSSVRTLATKSERPAQSDKAATLAIRTKKENLQYLSIKIHVKGCMNLIR